MSINYAKLRDELSALAVFRGVLNNSAMESLFYLIDEKAAIDTMTDDSYIEGESVLEDYANIAATLYEDNSQNPDLSKYILNLVLEDENFYIKKKAAGEKISARLEKTVSRELECFQALSEITSTMVAGFISTDAKLPTWGNSKVDFAKEYAACMKDITKRGYGIYAKHHAFTVKNGALVPVAKPDTQSLSQLFGYKRERDMIIKNTQALLYKGGCNNMLLYGDAGTGKSSTIKAVANEYAKDGLRLVEIRKDQLFNIPAIVEELSMVPLKFIIFIDDLSFTKNDDNFSALKAILEGSVTSVGDNVAIYATSNRRHLVRESMTDRDGDEVHVNDTLQELSSLSARFGLTITFQKPGKDEYLDIVENLAKEEGLKMDKKTLFAKAEAHAIRANGRTPRVAKQFVRSQKIGL